VSIEASLERLLGRWREQHAAQASTLRPVEIIDVERIRRGRPGLVDVVAGIDGRLAHAVFGVRRPGEPLRVVGMVDEPAMGTIDDEDGVGIVVDALHDPDAARLLLQTVSGLAPDQRVGDIPVVSLARDDSEAISLVFDRRVILTVFPWLFRGPHPGATLLAGLDEAGFNHLCAPIAFWRRAGRDLGIVQEQLVGATSGWALAIGSLRDLLASEVTPDLAGGDFAPESFALGTMAARMHLALDRAFGRRPGDVAVWVDELAPDLLAAGEPARRWSGSERVASLADDPDTDAWGSSARELLDVLGRSGLHPPTIRTHGDFHLGRTARTDQGWVLADTMPGGTAPGSEEPLYRSPLADMADFTWSLRRAAAVALGERGPAPSLTGAGARAAAWVARNRRAFVAAYLATPGIGALVPADRRLVRRLLRLFELERSARAGRSIWTAS
jgi:maltokinase